MKSISKASSVIYLFNAYSNLDTSINFISGSDRVGLELINQERDSVIVIGPNLFKKFVSKQNIFLSSDNLNIKNLYLRYLIRLWETFFILKKVSHSYKIEKIISTSDFFPDVIPAYLYANKLKWYAFTYHLYPGKFSVRNFLGRTLQNISFFLIKKSYKVITTNTEVLEFLKSNYKIINIKKVLLGIDYTKYGNKLKKNGELVFLGRIKKSKGVFDLPEVIFNLKESLPNIKLNIIGNGTSEDIEKLKQLIFQFNLNMNIDIFNNLDDKEVIEFLKKSSLLLQPSYEEGFGLSVLESLASGTPVVLYDLPVYRENFSQFELFYTPIGDRLKFSNMVKNALESKMPVYSRSLFKPFSWSTIYENIFFD